MHLRILPDEIARIDAWSRRQDHVPSRPEAIRRLLEQALREPQPGYGSNPSATLKASNMAGGVVDQMTDKSQSIEEQQRRKRRLIKGPGEFRNMRKK